ncbi:MAG: hypothetical protein J5684_01450, partial [Eubacterium sp.]|nr:hypothetical protein [Eubacterium sp.]
MIYLCFLAVEFGSVTEIRGIVPVSMNIQEIFLNLVIISFLWSVIHLIIGNIYISSIVTMLFFAVLGIVNHYVIMLHGMPLTFQEIQNFGTVMNIIGGIKISSDIAVFKIAAVFFITLFVFSTLFFLKMDKGATWFNTLWKRLIFVILNFAFVDLTLISPAAIKPDSILAWSWREVYPVYGYGLCSLESYQNLFNIVKEPEGYAVADIPRVDLSTWYSDERPDVILILNETFYDFNKITDLETDTEY